MSGTGEHKVYAVLDGKIDYKNFEPVHDLIVIDEEHALEQCSDWAFLAEMLEEVLNERDTTIAQLQAAQEARDPTKFHRAAHSLKGTALNLYLPGLVDVSKKLELLGKQLEVNPNDERLLSFTDPLLEHLLLEYERLEQYLPTAKQYAEEFQEGDGGYEEEACA